MKKKVTVNGENRTVEFSYEIGSLIKESSKPIKAKWGPTVQETRVSKITFTIDGKNYEGTRDIIISGAGYSERFTFFGVTTNSHKKAIEHILKNR